MSLTILKLSIPLYLSISNSFFSTNSIKKNCVDIKKINGNISKRIDGVLINVNNIININFLSISLKKEISSKRFKIKLIRKKIKEIKIIF